MMEEIIIYKYQLEEIIDAFRITNNIYNTNSRETCYARTVTRAASYAKNALNGKKDDRVRYA